MSLNPVVGRFGGHDPAVALFKNEKLIYAIEEERISRNKHAHNEFPIQAVESALDFADISLDDVEKILIPWKIKDATSLEIDHLKYNWWSSNSVLLKLRNTERTFEHLFEYLLSPESILKPKLQQLSSLGSVPEFEEISRHHCHAASAFYPSGSDQSLVLTIDSRGEKESTVV